MNPSDNNPDPLDELFKAQPVVPARDFADRTLSRLREENAARPEWSDDELDALLASQPVMAPADFADRVLAELVVDASAAPEVAEPAGDKVIGFPSWVIALGGIAAAMVIGMFSFISLFQYADEQKQSGSVGPMAQVGTPAVVEDANEQAADLTTEIVLVAEAPSQADAGLRSEVIDYEMVMTLDAELDDALLLADLETLNTLQAFLN